MQNQKDLKSVALYLKGVTIVQYFFVKGMDLTQLQTTTIMNRTVAGSAGNGRGMGENVGFVEIRGILPR